MHPHELKRAFESGENITSMLKQGSDSQSNTREIIETAYDLQAGTYVRLLDDDESIYTHKREYGDRIADEIRQLTDPTSIIEAGVGEGTTLSFVLDRLDDSSLQAHGFDISWSRIAWARRWMARNDVGNCLFSVANLFQIPYADACFDVVYTAHTIEPNGGNEQAILRELFRITSRYLVLVEPGYEFASQHVRDRMDRLGYCKGLAKTAESMGMTVCKHELMGTDVNPENPSAILVIEKDPAAPDQTPTFQCPNFGDALIDFGESLYSPQSLRAYPKIMGIPCLRPEDAIIASAYESFTRQLT